MSRGQSDNDWLDLLRSENLSDNIRIKVIGKMMFWCDQLWFEILFEHWTRCFLTIGTISYLRMLKAPDHQYF